MKCLIHEPMLAGPVATGCSLIAALITLVPGWLSQSFNRKFSRVAPATKFAIVCH
jgi:hypothetical protein